MRLWPLELETALLYGEIFRELRTRGRVLSQVDMMLAALARQMDLTLATSDRDFEALPDVRTESWL
jgi:predicted nucleic acid-binding protein